MKTQNGRRGAGATVGAAMCSLAAAMTITQATCAQATEPALFIRTFPNAAAGFVSSLTINPDGTLDLIGAFATTDTGPQAISLSPDGRFVAVAHGTAANVERLDVFGVAPDASLDYLASITVPNSPLSIAWMNHDTLAVTQTDFGGSMVGVYRWDPIGQSLTEIDREDTGGFNSDIIVHPHGRFLYTNDTSFNQIRIFEILEDGTLEFADAEPTAGVYQFGFGFDSLGTRLYAGGGISGGGAAILGFDVDSSSGELSPISGSPFFSPGASPNEVDVADGDLWAYVSHGTDATLRSFEVEPDGSLTPAGYSFDVGLQGTLGEADTLGRFVFVTDNSTSLDDKSGVYSFTIDPSDGDLIMNGADLYDTRSSTPDGLEVWDPAEGVYLAVSELRRGEQAEFRVTGATPGEIVALGYSVAGPGRTIVPQLGVTLDLANPRQAGEAQRASANGVATWTQRIPAQAPDDVWIQCAQRGRVSNVVQRLVR